MANNAPSADYLQVGSGKLFVARYAAGTTTYAGEFELGTLDDLTFTPAQEFIQKFNNQVAAKGLYDEVNVGQSGSFRGTVAEWHPDNLALFLFGTKGTYSQTGSTVTDESITTSSVQGMWYKTLYKSISSVTLKDDTVATTAAGNWSYDAGRGMIKILVGGTIADGSTVTVSYTYATTAWEKIAGMNVSNIQCFARFAGDPSKGKINDIEIWKCSIRSEGDISLIGKDYSSFQLTLNALDDTTNHPTDPYFRWIVRS